MTNYYTEEGDILVGKAGLTSQTGSTETVQGTTNTPTPTVYSPTNPAPTTQTTTSPTAPARTTQAASNGYVVVRNGQEYGGYNELPPGTGTIIFASDDPTLASDIAMARSEGYKVGIMVSASSSEDPTVYGQRLAYYQNTYLNQPGDVVVADTEFMAGGVHPDAGWTTQAAAAYQASALGTTQLAVTFMSGQASDMDYAAWQAVSSSTIFMPETYGPDGTMVGAADPAALKAQVQAAAGAGAPVIVMTAPGQTQVSGDPSNVYAPPPNYLGGGGNTTSGGTYTAGGEATPGPTVPGEPSAPPPTGETPGGTTGGGTGTPPVLTDWAQVYFGSLGLPANVIAQIETIFQKHGGDVNLANGLAEQYLETTPWFAQNFPGYQFGLRAGLYTDKQGYRDYVGALNQTYQQYTGQQVTTADVLHALGVAVDANGNLTQVGASNSPDFVKNQLQGIAFAAANRSEIQYAMGAGGGGQLSPAELTALGEEKAGLDTPLGQMLQVRLQQAAQKITGLFQGQTQNPSLQLGAQGLNAPSLLGQRGVDQRGAADLPA